MTPRSRYPGTQPFGDSPEDQARFFGRGEEAEELYLRVLSVPLLVQFGRSGLGKTSLLQAGLFPRLRQKPFLPAMIRLNDPNDTLTAAVVRSLREACDAEGLEFLPGDTSSLWQLLATTSIWRGDLLLTPVLVFDQFEEVFTLRDAELRRSVAAELGRIASAPAGAAPPVKIVISLREDYLGALEEFSAAIPGLFHERLRLEAMSEKAARAAITGPAQLEPGPDEPPYASPPFAFDPPALDAMVDYLQGSSGVIEPFQLQLLSGHAEAIAARKGTAGPVTLTLEDFRGAQEFASVLHNFYRGTLDKLSPPAQRRKAAALCEEGLLDAAGHRLMLHEGQILADYGVKPETLATLCQTRLVRTERRLESTFYEISHDRLAESIIAARQGRLPKKVRRALWAGGIAALVVVALLVIWNRSVERQRHAADTARRSAEGLLTFLLGEEFLGEIRETGRSSMLEAVRNKVEESGSAGRTPLNYALALRHQGDMQRIANDLPGALAYHRQSLAIFEELGLAREIGRAHVRVAEVLFEQGKITEARNRFELAIKAWERVIDGPDPSVDECVEYAKAFIGAAKAGESAGRADEVTARLDRAVGIASDVLFGGKGPCAANWKSVTPFPHGGAVAVLSEVAFLRSGNESGTAAMADHARRLQPQSVTARRRALIALLFSAWLKPPNEGLQDVRAVLTGFDELGRWDPRNVIWTRDRAMVLLNLAVAISKCHPGARCTPMPPLEDAQAMALEALTTMRALAADDPTNAVLHGEFVAALTTYVRVIAVAGNPAEAMPRLQEAERLMTARQRDPADAAAAVQLAGIFEQQARVLGSAGRHTEAAQTLQRAIAIYEPLHRQQQGNVRYIYSLTSARRQEQTLRTTLGDAAGAAATAAELARLDTALQAAKRAEAVNEMTVRENELELIFKIGDLMYGKSYKEALPELAVMQRISRAQIALSPANFASYAHVGQYYANIAEAEKGVGNAGAELPNLVAAMNAAQVAAWLARQDQRETRDLILLDARNAVATALFERKRNAEAMQVLRENVVLAGQMAQRQECIECRRLLGVAKCLFASGQPDVPADGLRSGIIHIESAAADAPRNFAIPRDLGYWRLKLADVLEKSGAKAEATAERRLALEAYRKSYANNSRDDVVKAEIARLERMLGRG